MTRPLVHVLTPGDHFSPRTGSAIPTIVDGLSRGASDGTPPATVVVARGTYADRYTSARAVEYPPRAPRRTDRYVDVAAARAGLPRLGSRRVLRPTLGDQRNWPASIVLAHNAPALVPLVDGRHDAVLYAHNQVLRSYTLREAGRVLRPARAVVCVSDFLAQQVQDRLPRELHGRVRTVRNGVDLERFAVPRAPRQGTLRVVFVGRVIRDKGVHVLLEAVTQLGRDDIDVTIVGRPGFDADAPLTPYERGLRQLAAAVRGRVRFASFVARPELPALLSAADVVAVPSIWPEPFGLTALEGMAAGAAVVASDIGGIPEAVGAGGTLVPAGDPRRLAEVLAAWADDDDALTHDALRARAHARKNGWATSAQALRVVLDDEGEA
ncbi:glycosyltransferase family 4 protein [Oerskovia flava]|uniref:glycosyltransferase family 4 protein n=1 Tax=Oerskovia flava TaxID=2986422 RepID=UPI00223FB7FE|nr:glycosyltransferase family 4 protein [Oerskovia sp. JB1-3-2]